MKIKLVFLMVLVLLNVQSVLVAQDERVHYRLVDLERLKLAMETALEKSTNSNGDHYDPTITTNGIRYQTDVLIDLIEEAMQGHEQPEGACLLFINYNDWYKAFKSVNCRDRKIPYVEQANKYKQNIVIDYNRKNVIEIDSANPDTPDIAANVTLYWEGGRKKFSYESEKSIPPLTVINMRKITYRLLKYNKDNLVVCDLIEGLKGQALDGFLWFLGKASMKQYRIVPDKGGPHYVLMETKKWFFPSWKSELTIDINGETTDGWKNKDSETNEKIKQTLEKAKQTLPREIDIQYSGEDLDYLLILADKLAELDCNNGGS